MQGRLFELIFKLVVAGILGAGLAYWLEWSRARATARGVPNTLRQPPALLWLALVLGTGCGAGLVDLFVHTRSQRQRLIVLACVIPLGGLAFFQVLECVLITHQVDSGGISYTRILRRGGRVQWRDIASVDYSARTRWLTFRTLTGSVFRISTTMTNLPALATYLLSAVEPTILSPSARAIVQYAASGSPPPILG